jgi:dimethylamine/trimethylamine dehydrogenase
VTSESVVSAWTARTLEQHRIHARVLALGIEVLCSHNITGAGAGAVEAACIYSEKKRTIAARSLLLVTSRQPNDALYQALAQDEEGLAAAGIRSLQKIGDCDLPSTIAAAVHDGHRAARELESPPANPDLPFRREHIALELDAI